MRSKSFIIFLIVLAFLIGLVLIKKGLKPKVPTSEHGVRIVEQPLSKDNITGFLITLGNNKIDISKKNNATKATVGTANPEKDQRWVIENYFKAFADEKKVGSFISMIGRLEGELRSDNKDLLRDYGIADNEGIHIELKNGPSFVASIVVGTKRAGSGNDFVRTEGTEAVYVVEEDILYALGLRGDVNEDGLKPDLWVDKSIIDLREEKATSIKLEKDEQAYIGMVKGSKDNKGLWAYSKDYPFKIDQGKVGSFIRTMSSLKAGSIVSPDKDGGFGASGWKMSVGLDNGRTIDILRGKKDKNDYYVKVSDKEYALKVPDYVLDNIDKTDGDFFVDNPLNINGNDVKEVIINDLDNKKTLDVKKIDTPIKDVQKKDVIAVWTSGLGEVFKTDDVNGVINKLKDISIKTLPEKTQSVEDSLIVKLTKADGSFKEYDISKVITMDNGKEASYLVIKGDRRDYCVAEYIVSSLKAAIADLDKNKTSPKIKEDKDEVKSEAEAEENI